MVGPGKGKELTVEPELSIGDRVRLSALGQERSSRMRARGGTVVGLPAFEFGGRTVVVLLDGNKRPTRLHRSYIELDNVPSVREN